MNEQLVFGLGETRVCHTITITNDNICESDPNEFFFSDLSYVSGIQPIAIDPSRAQVIIDDTNEPECGKYSVFIFFSHAEESVPL